MPIVQSLTPHVAKPLRGDSSPVKHALPIVEKSTGEVLQPQTGALNPGSAFDASCERELMKTHGTAERVEKGQQAVGKLLWNEATEMPPANPYGKSEASISAEIEQAQALRDLSEASLHHSMRALMAVTAGLPGDKELADGEIKLNKVLDVLPDPVRNGMVASGMMRSPAFAPNADGDHTPGSYGDFWDKLSSAIGGLKTDYLGVYEKAVEKNNAFYRDFTKFVSDSVKWTVGDKDVTLTLDDVEAQVTDADVNAKFYEKYPNGIGSIFPAASALTASHREAIENEIKAKIRTELEAARPGKRTGFLVALRELLHKYEPSESQDAGVLVSIDADPADGADAEAKARKWASDMGLPPTSVEQNPLQPGQWWVKVDLEPVKNMIEQLEKISSPGAKTVTLSPARHSAYQAGAETQKEQLKTTASTLGQKMAGAQSIYENLIKVLTSTISAMLDSAKSFLMN